jgi:3-dehydroshikimate dehydratase
MIFTPKLTPRSVATVTLGDGSLDDKMSAAAAWYDGIEICQPDLEGRSPAAAGRLADRLGLKVHAWQPLRDMEGAAGDVFKANLARARQVFGAAAALGAPLVIAVSSCAPDTSADPALTAAQLGNLADLAATYDLSVAYEALSWGTRVRTAADAWRLVQLAGRPNLGICLDSFHFLARGEDPDLIRQIPAATVFAVQLADAPARPEAVSYLEWSRHHRCFPGYGDLDVAGFAAAVLDTGYQGPWSLEIFSDSLRGCPPAAAAEQGAKAFMFLEDALGSEPVHSKAEP